MAGGHADQAAVPRRESERELDDPHVELPPLSLIITMMVIIIVD
jgi:hypothetical protein